MDLQQWDDKFFEKEVINVISGCNPLTSQEIKFAKAFKVHEKIQNKLATIMNGDAISAGDNPFTRAQNCDDAREIMREITTLHRENAHLFTPDFMYALHGKVLEVICGEQWLAEMAESRARQGNSFRHFLPEGGFSVDALRNAVQIGMGSRIPMGRYNLHVFDNMVGAFENHWRNPQDALDAGAHTPSAYTRALNWLLHASATGNSSLNTSVNLSDDRGLNADVISLLQKMGVDTSRPFSVNGTTFEIRGGKVQTQGYTPRNNASQNRTFIGEDGMRDLVSRAYSQNLFGTGSGL